jgi:hypothetical protein
LLAEILNFQGTNPIWGMGSLSNIVVESDFRENPFYKIDTKCGFRKYCPYGGIATKAEMLKKQLDQIKSIVEHNNSLKGKYNFRIECESNSDRYEGDKQKKGYSSVMEIVNEISQTYF